MIVNGEQKGYVLRQEKQIYLEESERWNVIAKVIYPGKYMMRYDMYKTTDTSKIDEFATLIVNIEIIKITEEI